MHCPSQPRPGLLLAPAPQGHSCFPQDSSPAALCVRGGTTMDVSRGCRTVIMQRQKRYKTTIFVFSPSTANRLTKINENSHKLSYQLSKRQNPTLFILFHALQTKYHFGDCYHALQVDCFPLSTL